MKQPTFVIDFDSTLVTVESLDELARIALADNPDRAITLSKLEALTNAGMAGTLPFDESLKKRLALFGATRRHIDVLVAQLRDQVSLSAIHNTVWFTENRDRIFVISGGFEEYIVPVVESLGIDCTHVFANQFTYDNDGNITGYNAAKLSSRQRGKVLQLEALQLPRPIVTIGDAYTDFETVKYGQADEFWAFTESITRPVATVHAATILHDFSEVVALAKMIDPSRDDPGQVLQRPYQLDEVGQ